MVPRDDKLDTFWSDEKDWLVEVVMLADSEPEDERAVVLDWIGRVFGFATVTNTRMLAMVSDEDDHGAKWAYELWFSFDSAGHKNKFLEFVKSDGYAIPDGHLCFGPPSSAGLAALPKLRPLGQVFAKEDMDRITAIGAITYQTIMEPSITKVN